MLEEISVHQFREWMAYAEIEPFDERRADLRSAMVTWAIVNVNRKRGSSIIPVDTFMPKFDDDVAKPAKSWQEMKAIGYMIATGKKLG